jgi:TM2 domain-containing membrane protein YozV
MPGSPVCPTSAVQTNEQEGAMSEPAQDAVTACRDGIAHPPRTVRRHPWIAGFCSGLAPGLGQVYNGQATKALLLYGLGWGVGLAALAILLGVPTAPWNVAIPGLVVLSWYVYRGGITHPEPCALLADLQSHRPILVHMEESHVAAAPGGPTHSRGDTPCRTSGLSQGQRLHPHA